MMRRYTFKLYPTAAQNNALRGQCAMHAQLWNALLQTREDWWRRQSQVAKEDRRGLTYFDQSAEITKLRAECPEWRELNASSLHRTAQLLDEAFKAFFRRLKTGEKKAGYPRFKRSADATTIPFKTNGWKLSPTNMSGTGWRLRVHAIDGLIKARGRLPIQPTCWRNAEIIWRQDAWWISVCLDMPVRQVPGGTPAIVRFDLIDQFASIEFDSMGPRTGPPAEVRAYAGKPPTIPEHCKEPVATDSGSEAGCEDGQRARLGVESVATDSGSEVGCEIALQALGSEVGCEPQADDRSCGRARVALDSGNEAECERGMTSARALCARADGLQAERDRRWPNKPGVKWSWRKRRETKRVARLRAKAARIRKNALHEWSTAIVRAASDITVVAPRIKESTASPRGTKSEWGAMVGSVSDLNRNTLNQAPAMAMQMLAYKAEEAGIRFDVVQDEAPKIAVGHDLVVAGKTHRRVKRELKKAA